MHIYISLNVTKKRTLRAKYKMVIARKRKKNIGKENTRNRTRWRNYLQNQKR